MDHSTYADIELRIDWKSRHALHTERHFYQGINFRRDFFPRGLGEKLISAPDGEWVSETMAASEIIPAYSKTNVHKVALAKINPVGPANIQLTPRQGRFYPRNFIAGEAGVTSEEFQPLRVISIAHDSLTVDLNHPLAREDINVSLRIIGQRYAGKEERSGRCNDVVYELLTSGPGMQAPHPDGTDYYTDDAFSRIDERDDALLYLEANLEDTYDRAAGAQITELYRGLLTPDSTILDMMCGAQSYLPDDLRLSTTGIGLNKEELQANKQLEAYVVQNVNTNHVLPFADNEFDAITYTAAVEYLVDPLRSFAEFCRVVRPGGRIILTFTDHWNSMKSIKLWSELHHFERMGLVLDYCLRSGMQDLHTQSIQGQLRPQADPKADKKIYADPVYAVYGAVAEPGK